MRDEVYRPKKAIFTFLLAKLKSVDVIA